MLSGETLENSHSYLGKELGAFSFNFIGYLSLQNVDFIALSKAFKYA